jgi:hypothetical protein
VHRANLLGEDFRKWYPTHMNGAASLDEVRLRKVFRALQENAVEYADLEVELKTYDEVSVRVVTPRTLWLLKKDTVRPLDRLDAAMLAERFGLEKK